MRLFATTPTMPRLIVHGFTISLGTRVFRFVCVNACLLLAFALTTVVSGCQDHIDHEDPVWNERIAEQERIDDAAKGDSVISKGDTERTVTYYIAGEKVKQEYYYHDRLVSCLNYSNGRLNGYGIEWNRDGTLYFVAHYVDGKVDGPSEKHWRTFGQKAFTTYRMGEVLQSDTVPLTDRDSPHFERDVVKR
jgi:hypothetical protein